MKLILLALISLFNVTVNAQQYSVKNISDSLLENANAVKRTEELKVKIFSPDHAEVQHKWAITILNAAGDNFNGYEGFYDKFWSAPDVSGTLYDANGKEVRTLKKKDIIDHAENDEVSMVSDSRIKSHNFFYNQYPYTIEYEEDQDIKGTFFLPGWSPVEGEHFAVQNSKYIVETPADYKLRYRQNNYHGQVKIENSKNITYTWEANNLIPVVYEVFQPAFSQIVPNVKIGPSNFQIGGYNGSMDSWLNLGKFINTLNKDRDILPEETKKEVHTLTDALTDPKQKINVLYEYLQHSTRYISIQNGIGSWQPFDATYVATKKYGDCKALSNYMVALLKEAGIKANYVLINGGIDRVISEDFPSPNFNHAIACVPFQKDTIWLECTSQTESPGYMGSFTGNRKALLIDQDGGHLVNTPEYKQSDNLACRKIKAIVDETGNLTADINTKYTGLQQELPHSLLHEANKDQKEKYLNRALGLPTYSIDKFDYLESRNTIPAIDEYIKLTAPNYASVTGKRLFVTPNIVNRKIDKLPVDSHRIYPICIKEASVDLDSVYITIPSGYSVESVPEDVHLKTKFGNYDISFKIKNSNIEVIRSFTEKTAVYPPSDYISFSDFYQSVFKGDRSTLVFIKKEG